MEKKAFEPPPPGYGTAWLNRQKTGSQPDFQGSVTLLRDYRAGEQLGVSVWIKKTRAGHDYLSIAEQKQREGGFSAAPDREVSSRYAPKNNNIDDSDVPF